MNVDERILELRRHMEEKDIDIYVALEISGTGRCNA